jgi:hypothetical protein
LKKQENSIFCSIKINIRYKDGDIYFIISRGAKNSSKGSKNIVFDEEINESGKIALEVPIKYPLLVSP